MSEQGDRMGDPDELVSAVLDGEASADDVTRVNADPALSARLAELSALRDRLQAEPSAAPPPAARDAAIHAAVAAAATPRSATPLWRRAAPVVAAAAAVLLVVLGIGTILRSSKSMTSSASKANSSGALAAPTTALPPAPDVAADETASSATADLGAFPNADALVTAVQTAVQNTRDSQLRSAAGASTLDQGQGVPAPTTAPPRPRCPPPAADQVLLTASAMLDGQPVEVFVIVTAGTEHVQVDDATTCEIVVTRPI